MTDRTALRQQIAARTPELARKAFRMAENYVNRGCDWARVLRSMRGVDPVSRKNLALSALAAPVTALRKLDGYAPPRLLSNITVDVDGVGTFDLRRGTDDIIHVLRAREPHVFATLVHLLKPGAIFVDAGANIGFYSVLASRLVGRHGRVLACEMMPDTARRLRRHLKINECRNAEVVEKALSSSDSKKVIALSDPASLGQASITSKDLARSLAVEVETATLESVLEHYPAPIIVKMDLEGSEFLALQGCKGAFSRIAAVVFENNREDDRIFQLLHNRGFAVRHLAGHDYVASGTASQFAHG